MSYKSLLFFTVSFILIGCINTDFSPKEWAITPELDFSKEIILFNSNNNVDSVEVFTNYQKFEVSSSAEWCSASVKNKSSIKIIAEPNIDTKQRTATITVSVSRGSKSLSKNLAIVQSGGSWEAIGDFNVYWSYMISDTQREHIIELLSNMEYIEGGCFIMGNTDSPIVDNTHPHNVSLSSFYIGKFEVTQQQWRTIMGTNPSTSKGDMKPIYNISWMEAFEFTTRLSELTNLNITLPTEAQWEYAALGGKMSNGYKYAGSNDYTEVSVVGKEITEPLSIGTKKCNELGIYDMSGNVAEYCSDWFEPDFEDNNTTDPNGPDSGFFKCVRGGHVNDTASIYHLGTVNRHMSASTNEVTHNTGFRIVIIHENE